MKLVLASAMAAFALAGCAPQVIHTTPTQTYQVGQRLAAAPGGVILASQQGKIETVRRWVGFLNSPDGWETTAGNSGGYLRKELIYSGAAGSTIEIAYREFRGNLAAPAFYQSAKYDLSTSREITFQQFRIRVESAGNNGFTGVLLSDGISNAGGAIASGQTRTPPTRGESTVQAEAVAKAASCQADPVAALAGKGPGFESYTVPCTGGDVMMIRCEFGNCRILR